MVDPQVLLIVVALALSIWVGEQAVKGVKYVGHKTKCGIELVVGKHCNDAKKLEVPVGG